MKDVAFYKRNTSIVFGLNFPQQKAVKAYLFLTTLVMCGLVSSIITAQKIVYLGMNFPFSNLVISILTYPIIDSICELWGKPAARLAVYLSLLSQILFAIIIYFSIITPHASFWDKQSEYQLILATGIKILIASLLAFLVSQILDIILYQKLKELCQGKKLWLRANLATYLGQTIDTVIFVNIVFAGINQKMHIIAGALIVKLLLSVLMTPVIYLIVYLVKKYLTSGILSDKIEDNIFTAHNLK